MQFLPITDDDLPLIRSMKSDPRMMEHLGGVQTEEQILHSFENMLKSIERGAWCFKFVPEPGGPVAGIVVIWESTHDEQPIHEIGWMVLPQFQGRGVASEAVRMILDRGRRQRAFEAIHAFPNVENAASNRICEKYGFSNLGACEIDFSGRTLKCNHWRIELQKTMKQPNNTEGAVRLRSVQESDMPIFFEHQKDPAANQMAAFTRKDPADREAFMAHWTRILGDRSIVVRTVLFDEQVAGSVASFIDEKLGQPEVTYWIGREFWGRGIATRALVEFMELQQARPLYARAAKDNLGSIRVLEKCGFSFVRCDRGFANARGEEIEEVVLIRKHLAAEAESPFVALTAEETKWLTQVNEVPPPGVRERWRELDQMRREGILDATQQLEMTRLYDQIEANQVRRIEAAAKLAKLRNVSIDTMMEQFGITTSGDDD